MSKPESTIRADFVSVAEQMPHTARCPTPQGPVPCTGMILLSARECWMAGRGTSCTGSCASPNDARRHHYRAARHRAVSRRPPTPHPG